MSRSNDAGHFFQTSDALATTERKTAKAKNQHGNPIKLPSKILAACPGPSPGSIFVAEAAGEVKLVDLETHKITKIFSQGTAPLTCLALQTPTSLFTGCWDKTIYNINPSDPSQPAKKLHAHTDFVKCLLTTTLTPSAHPILISGAADATIIIWDILPSSPTYLKPLHKLKAHAKALQSLAIDDLATPSDHAHIIVCSSSSTAEIRRWTISLASAAEIPESQIPAAHETSIYQLLFDASGDMWTASADKTAKHLVREREYAADATLQHPDFVRCVLPFENLGVVVTGCRDEEVRVWDIASGKVVCTYSGHFEEVTGLVAGREGRGVVSVSIDGTVRQWSLKGEDMKRFEEERARERSGDGGGDEKEGKQKESMLTAEEEAELAELMDDDDDED